MWRDWGNLATKRRLTTTSLGPVDQRHGRSQPFKVATVVGDKNSSRCERVSRNHHVELSDWLSTRNQPMADVGIMVCCVGAPGKNSNDSQKLSDANLQPVVGGKPLQSVKQLSPGDGRDAEVGWRKRRELFDDLGRTTFYDMARRVGIEH